MPSPTIFSDTKVDHARRVVVRLRRQRFAREHVDVLAERTPCNYPAQWRGSRMLRLSDGALAYTTGLPAFDAPDDNGHTQADRAEIEHLTRLISGVAARLADLLGGEQGDAVKLRVSQVREAVKRGTGIKV